MHCLFFLSLYCAIAGNVPDSPLYDPDSNDETSSGGSGVWNSRIPLKNRWSIPKASMLSLFPNSDNSGLEAPRTNPLTLNDAYSTVQIALAKMMDDLTFGMQMAEQNRELKGLMDQLKFFTSFISDLYKEMNRNEHLDLKTLLWGPAMVDTYNEGGIVEDPATQENNTAVTKSEGTKSRHFVVPASYTNTETSVPEIYYEIFKAYKDERSQRG